MCWHPQKETSVGSAGGLKFDRYQGESSRGFFNPTFGMSSPRAATSVATRKVLFPLAFRSTSPKKLESDSYTTRGLASNLFGTHLVKNFRDIWVHDSTCHSWHTSNWFTQVSMMFGYLIYLDPVTPHDFDSAPLESGQRGFSLLLLLTVSEKSSPRMKKILGRCLQAPILWELGINFIYKFAKTWHLWK